MDGPNEDKKVSTNASRSKSTTPLSSLADYKFDEQGLVKKLNDLAPSSTYDFIETLAEETNPDCFLDSVQELLDAYETSCDIAIQSSTLIKEFLKMLQYTLIGQSYSKKQCISLIRDIQELDELLKLSTSVEA